MNKEFIPYEQALELKELGFDEHCFMIYYVNNSALAKLDGLPIGIKNTELDNTKISAPLYQQAFRFFREKYDLMMHIQRHSNNKYLACMGIQVEILCDNYEEAELACLKKLIELAKNK